MASNAAFGACIGCSQPFRTRGEICGVPKTYRKLHPGLPASAGFHINKVRGAAAGEDVGRQG
eukprot:7390258-Prymnesium_polylepis.1